MIMKIFKLKYFILLLLAVSLGILFFVNVQKTKSEGFKAMLTNPVANMQLTTAREVKRYQRDRDTVLGKTSSASIIVKYEPIGNYTKGDVYDEIVENIENTGWNKRDVTSSLEDRYYVAKTRYGTSNRILVVEVFNHPESSSVSLDIGAY